MLKKSLENLTEKISGIFDKIKGKGVIDDTALNNVMREIRIALLESDVSISVAKFHGNVWPFLLLQYLKGMTSYSYHKHHSNYLSSS